VQARVVIGADGRGSAVARWVNAYRESRHRPHGRGRMIR
jgi:2-polyprenyl-6-methoxyphenol hydroxylase-like FAD-dependent oxidoreductase